MIRLAKQARLALGDDEVAVLADQLAGTLDAVARVQEVDTDGVASTTHAVRMVNVTRPDVLIDCLSRDDVLAAAPDVEDRRFRVPGIRPDAS